MHTKQPNNLKDQKIQFTGINCYIIIDICIWFKKLPCKFSMGHSVICLAAYVNLYC